MYYYYCMMIFYFYKNTLNYQILPNHLKFYYLNNVEETIKKKEKFLVLLKDKILIYYFHDRSHGSYMMV
jgi:hypothetical protein